MAKDMALHHERRPSAVGKEELKDMVKSYITVIERFQMQRDLEEFMKKTTSPSSCRSRGAPHASQSRSSRQ